MTEYAEQLEELETRYIIALNDIEYVAKKFSRISSIKGNYVHASEKMVKMIERIKGLTEEVDLIYGDAIEDEK
jgi:hypothetical protein